MKIQKIIQNFNAKRINRMMDKHVIFANESPIANELNKMRYPIALWAKENDVFINMYQPDNTKKSTQNIYNLVVTSLKKRDYPTIVSKLSINPEDKYIHKQTSKILVPDHRHSDIRLVANTTSTTEDDYIRYIFRTIEEMVKQINQ